MSRSCTQILIHYNATLIFIEYIRIKLSHQLNRIENYNINYKIIL